MTSPRWNSRNVQSRRCPCGTWRFGSWRPTSFLRTLRSTDSGRSINLHERSLLRGSDDLSEAGFVKLGWVKRDGRKIKCSRVSQAAHCFCDKISARDTRSDIAELAAWGLWRDPFGHWRFLEFREESDDVHLLVENHPALNISTLINNLKTAGSRRYP
jgi:hypothetical protein